MDFREKARRVLLRAVIWGMAGGFFGVGFVAFRHYLDFRGEAGWHPIAAAAVSGALVAAFYSAKTVALLGAAAGSIVATIYLVVADPFPLGLRVAGACAAAGLVTGALASIFYEHERGALPMAAIGSVAGVFAGVVVALLAAYSAGVGDFLQALLAAGGTGGLFALSVAALAGRVEAIVPHRVSVALVSAGVAAGAGSGLWTLAGTLELQLDPHIREALDGVVNRTPYALLGGMIGGAIAGALLEFFGVNWLVRFLR